MGELLFPFLLGVLMNAYDDLIDGDYTLPKAYLELIALACAGVACISFYISPVLCIYFGAIAGGCYASDVALARWRTRKGRAEGAIMREGAAKIFDRTETPRLSDFEIGHPFDIFEEVTK